MHHGYYRQLAGCTEQPAVHPAGAGRSEAQPSWSSDAQCLVALQHAEHGGRAEVQLQARWRIGVLSAGLETAANQHARRTAATCSKREALANAGLTKDEAHRCEQIARVPEAAFEANA